MNLTMFFQGLVLGFSIAAPVGPIGILCIQRTLARGMGLGFVSGLGAATADAIYGCIAGFGLTVIANFLVAQQLWFRLLGGSFLAYLGVKIFLTSPAKSVAAETELSYGSAYGTTLFLTLTNPMTILAFAAIFAGLGVVDTAAHSTSASLLVIGVFVGSGLWWGILSGVTGLLHGKLDARKLSWINKIAGLIVLTFALLAFTSVLL
ncbi:LysE family translocator, partial [candidate division KSB3 bacterium]|nr:LysE family translocator [candidate division KSB3 bacterium]MBD3325689.1 LysE family translocator [candidate division KSB3 bacterium]